MAQIADINMQSQTKLGSLLELSRDYCSDQLGRFFQNKYSPPAAVTNKFVIPANLVTESTQERFAICVMMNNHIMDLKYFSEIFPDWDNQLNTENISTEQALGKINTLIDDKKLLSVIKSFKKTNDEIVIGRCKGNDFIPL